VTLAFRSLPALALLAVLVIAGCTNAPPPPPKFAPITFTQYGPIRLSVSQVETVQEYTPPLQPPNVDHLFPVTPSAVAQRWPTDRLVANGGGYTARFVVQRASAVEVALPRSEGIRGAFTTDQAYRYDAVIEVALEIRNDRGFRDAVVTARVERSRSVAEDITVNDREKVWYEMSKDMGVALNTELDRNIRATLGRYIVN
jgi:hypothetical protein